MELRRSLLEAVFPAFIVFVLWLDGWFYPLILLPFLLSRSLQQTASRPKLAYRDYL